jgi:hypothetical protein
MLAMTALFAFFLQVSHITKFHAALSPLSDLLNFLSFWNLPQTAQIPVIMVIIIAAVIRNKSICYNCYSNYCSSYFDVKALLIRALSSIEK